MAKKSSGYAVVVLLVLGLLFAGGYWTVRSHADTICNVCQRPINHAAGVIAEIGGRRRHVCCARCAVTEARQERTSLRFLAVTDYPSGRRIDPAGVWFVEGSRKVACNHDMHMPMDASKRPGEMDFDRCAPGAFAFATRADAETFIAQNGGVILSLAEMTGQGRHP